LASDPAFKPKGSHKHSYMLRRNSALTKGLLVLALFIGKSCFSQTQYPFQNTSLGFEERVNDLVSRLTLEEKVGQMLNTAPAILRLGVPAYDWWSEVLHGVARTPYKVTVYPQAIAMAATFDTASLKTMADYSAMEGRAIYNKAIKEGKAGQRYTAAPSPQGTLTTYRQAIMIYGTRTCRLLKNWLQRQTWPA
jgi:hypothetical protein